MSWRGDLKLLLSRCYANPELKLLVEESFDDADLLARLPSTNQADYAFADQLVGVVEERDLLEAFLRRCAADKTAFSSDFLAILERSEETPLQRLLYYLRHSRNPALDAAALLVPVILALFGVADRLEVPLRAAALAGGPPLPSTTTTVLSLREGRPPSELRRDLARLVAQVAEHGPRVIVITVAHDAATDSDPAFCQALSRVAERVPVVLSVRAEGDYSLPESPESCAGVELAVTEFLQEPWFESILKAPLSIVDADAGTIYHAAIAALRLADGRRLPRVQDGRLVLGSLVNRVEGNDIYLARVGQIPRVEEGHPEQWARLTDTVVVVGEEGEHSPLYKLPGGRVTAVMGTAHLVETVAQQRAPLPVRPLTATAMAVVAALGGLLFAVPVRRRLFLVSALPAVALVAFAYWDARNGALHSFTSLVAAGILAVAASLFVRGRP